MSRAPACAPTSPPRRQGGRAAAARSSCSPSDMSRLEERDLAPGVHLALVAEDLVVLDVRADAYSLIPGGAALTRPSRNGAGLRAEGSVLSVLDHAGLVVPASCARRPAMIPARRQADLNTSGAPLSRAPALLHAMTATVAFRRLGLASLAAAAARRKGAARDRSVPENLEEAAVREAALFESVRPWVPFEGDCLQRSWMLHRRLCRHGVPADWVFGVRTWPFFAHCWVQVGDLVLGDSLNRVGGFTPIMVV